QGAGSRGKKHLSLVYFSSHSLVLLRRLTYISAITIGEIAKGISKMTASKRKKSLTNWLNETLPNRFEQRILSIDFSTMVLWGNLVGQLEQNGRPLPAMDSLIAAIALQNSLSLVTRNENDFAGTGVVIVNPWSI
ncbi:type II toxin-antitoxin system VapC family toxin, partial [Scytonema hofmannii]|uniref:type II toxin-antitoxin system VapC family toxin n=1 Tax=Scytonema hofmannii TaxID=34078 RepID=UPI0028BF16B5